MQPIASAFQWILAQAWSFIQWLWSQVPAIPVWPGPDVAAGISFVLGYIGPPLAAINYYSPVNLFFVLVLTILAAEGVLATWHGLRWLLAHLPWVGGDV